MSKRKNLGKAFLLLSLLPVGFLIYTLLNLNSLGITLFHPRVIVEFSAFVLCVSLGIWLVRRNQRSQ
jgi:hypothetical protein